MKWRVNPKITGHRRTIDDGVSPLPTIFCISANSDAVLLEGQISSANAEA